MPLKFGEVDPRVYRRKRGAQKYGANGYAATPGSGPEGEFCKTCKHLYRHERSKAYLKCNLMRHAWTCGPGSDVRANSPACARWESPDEDHQG